MDSTITENNSKLILNNKRLNLFITAIIFIVAVFSFLTIPDGQAWGDDFAMYLMHARNIAEGQAYNETGYIFNKLEPEYAPQNYPPGFPLLITPIYKFAGLNLYPYKIFILICFLVFLFLSYKFLIPYLSPLYTLIIIFFLAFSPFLWEYRNHILSDIPAAMFFMLSLLLAKRTVESQRSKDWLLLVISVYISYLVRPAGFVVLPAAILHSIHFHRKIKFQPGISILLFTGLVFITGFFFKSESGYLSTTINDIQSSGFLPYIKHLLLKLHLYIFSFEDFAVGSMAGSQLNKLFFYILTILIFISLIRLFRIKPDFICYTLLFYTGIILIWPAWQGLRFFIPVLPLFFYFLFKLVSDFKKIWLKKTITILITLVIFFLFGFYYFTANYPNEVQYGVQEKDAVDVFNYIKTETPEDAVIMASKPRAFCLFTKRKGIVFPEHKANQLNQNIKDYKVSYIVLSSTELNNSISVEMNKNPEKFNPVYTNPNFTVYKIK